MAQETTIGGNGTLFVGEDKTIRLALVDALVPTTAIDLTGKTMVFDVRKLDTSADPAILSLTPTLEGVFNASAALNTQRAIVTISSTNMDLFRASNYRWSWKQTNAGAETVLAWGTFAPQKATAP